MNELQVMTAGVALKDMFKKGHFSISTVRDIQKMNPLLHVDQESMQILANLHCVDFSDMPPELLRSMPVLLEKVIGSHMKIGKEADWLEYLKPHLRIA